MNKIEDRDYLYACGRIRVLEGMLLNKDRTARLLDVRSGDNAQKVLSECGYSGDPPRNPSELETLLSVERIRVFATMEKVIPDRRLTDVFRMPWDYHNIKTLIKASFSSVDSRPSMVEFGRISPERFLDPTREASGKTLPPAILRAMAEATEVLTRTGDPQLMDILLDKACFKEMLSFSTELGDPFLTGYIRLTIDAANLKILVRGSVMEKSPIFIFEVMIPGGHTAPDKFKASTSESTMEEAYAGSLLGAAATYGKSVRSGAAPLHTLDLLCDNALMAYLHTARTVTFGPSPVVAYLAAKEFEISALRMIFSGRLTGQSSEKVLERIRDYYV